MNLGCGNGQVLNCVRIKNTRFLGPGGTKSLLIFPDPVMHALTGSLASSVTVHSLISGPWWPSPWSCDCSAQPGKETCQVDISRTCLGSGQSSLQSPIRNLKTFVKLPHSEAPWISRGVKI